MRNIALVIQYLGTSYAGWQSQTNATAIQDILENALYKILGHKTSLCGSGRTDAGVHASAQVANFLTENPISVYKLPLGLNNLLPNDISVVSAHEVDEDFNSRSHAKSKTYAYRFYVSPSRLPLLDITHAQIYKTPDVAAMCEAAKCFIGVQDFKNFSSTGSNAKTTVREIYRCEILLSAAPESAVIPSHTLDCNLFNGEAAPATVNETAVPCKRKGGIITIEVCGSAFLYNMVRIIAGTLLAVGKGLLTPDDVRGIFVNGRPKCVKTAPPRGLTLEKVEYRQNKSGFPVR